MSVVDSSSIGWRLSAARVARNLTQQSAADALGVPRTAITQIENGKRSVSTLELTKLARLYRRPVTCFIEETVPQEEDDALVALYRMAPGLRQSPVVNDQVERCFDLCRAGITLGKALGLARQSGPPMYDMPVPRTAGEAVTQGEKLAHEERQRIGIGHFPIPDISELIIEQGILASGINLPRDMSGLFMRHSSIGSVIMVNASHSYRRKRFSYAHEYAHALMDRDRDVMISSADNSAELVEKRANAFAAAFLMPANGVHEEMETLNKGRPSRREQAIFDVASDEQIKVEVRVAPRSQRITYTDATIIARHFGVSYQATIYQLQNLGHISRQEATELLKKEGLGRKYLKALNMLDDNGKPEQVPCRNRDLRVEITKLAIEAYRREKISRGRLLELSTTLDVPGGTLLELAEAA